MHTRQVVAPSNGNSDKSVLIIEDNSDFANRMARLAKENGLIPMVVSDPAKGLNFARQFKPSCILLDQRHCENNGFDLLGLLRKDPTTKEIPIQLVPSELAPSGQGLDAVGYLLKPATSKQLSEVIGRLQLVTRHQIRRILVVDDELIQRDKISELIGTEFTRPTVAASANEAFELLLREPQFDCMILDLNLPDQPGLELLKRIHADKRIVPPPVVIHTAKDLSQNEEEALRRYSESIIIKGGRSDERLLDEVKTFIHKVAQQEPTVKAQPKATPSDKPLPTNALNGRKILLVDDDIRNIFALSEAMVEKGLKVVTARNGQEALNELNKDSSIELVLMDVMMPVMDGLQAMRAIRQNPKTANIPMIALTAKAMKGDKESCLDAGANDYLPKPVDTAQLFNLLRVWLKK